MVDSKKVISGESRFRVVIHDRKPGSVSAFMVRNAHGAICGGNARVFCETDYTRYDLEYPTVFSRREAKQFMYDEREYLDGVSRFCTDKFKPTQTEAIK